MHYLDFCTHFVIKCDQFTCTASFIKWSGLHLKQFMMYDMIYKKQLMSTSKSAVSQTNCTTNFSELSLI